MCRVALMGCFCMQKRAWKLPSAANIEDYNTGQGIHLKSMLRSLPKHFSFLYNVTHVAGWSHFSPLTRRSSWVSPYVTRSKLHRMFLKCGSFGALSQCLITEHFLVSFGGLLGAFQSPASRVCGHFSVSQIPLQCGQSCPMVKCLKFYVKWKMVFWL